MPLQNTFCYYLAACIWSKFEAASSADFIFYYIMQEFASTENLYFGIWAGETPTTIMLKHTVYLSLAESMMCHLHWNLRC